jgi:U6 snRNA-associated Sm-like protein LSm6
VRLFGDRCFSCSSIILTLLNCVASKMDAPLENVSVKKNPTDFLKQVIGKAVVVKLNSGVTYKGVLACLDGFMNIAMEQTEEYYDGQLKNRYGDCFIRGNNGADFFSNIIYVFNIISV